MYYLLAPEILTALAGLAVLVAGLAAAQRGQRAVAALSSVSLGLVLVLVLVNFRHSGTFFAGVYQVDIFANFFRLLFLLAALLILAMSGSYTEFFGQRRSEWFSFMIFATLGMMIMASAGDMLTLYLGLELMTISFYLLSAYLLGDSRSAEAGLKYLIMGALSSAVLLFGMSLVYAGSGSTVFTEISRTLATSPATRPVLMAGIVMMMAALGFKISAVPFHMWAPDIYEGAPTPVTAYLAVASKAAGFAALLRIFMGAVPLAYFNWSVILAVLAALTIVAGNLIALAQHNIKRLLAYSSIAQAGYILVGVAAANYYGLLGVLFYALLYVFANVGAFTVAIQVEVDSGSSELEAFSSLGRRSPLSAAVMTVCMLSLAGIPPLAGFAGKFYLFSGAVQSGYLGLAFVGLLMSMISVYYYLSVVKIMYIGTNPDTSPLSLPRAVRLTLWICLFATLLIGIYPAPLASLAAQASHLFFF